jgi:hypothetical protein
VHRSRALADDAYARVPSGRAVPSARPRSACARLPARRRAARTDRRWSPAEARTRRRKAVCLPFDSFVITSYSCVRVARPRPCRRLCAALHRGVAPVFSERRRATHREGSRQPPKLEQGLLNSAAVHRSSFRLTFLASPSPPVPGVAMRRATLGGWPREDFTTRASDQPALPQTAAETSRALLTRSRSDRSSWQLRHAVDAVLDRRDVNVLIQSQV